MKIVTLFLATLISITAQADEVDDVIVALDLLKQSTASVICIDNDTAYGFIWNGNSNRVDIAVAKPADDLLVPGKALILTTFPGEVRLDIPDAGAVVSAAKDKLGNSLGLTYGSMGNVSNMICSYRADDTLYRHVLNRPSSSTIILE